MINVAWGNEFILPILNTLDQEKVKATFFLDGSWLKKILNSPRRFKKEDMSFRIMLTLIRI